MKFKKFLNEATLEKIEEAAKMIARDCKPYLKENTIVKTSVGYIFKSNGTLYRGCKGKVDVFKKITPRSNRIPVDITVDIHKRLDVLFKEKFGWKVRSEGVFTTGSKFVAGCYGGDDGGYIVFPIGKYKFVWSPKVYDMWDTLRYTYNLTAGESGGKKQSLYTIGLTTHEKILKDIVNSFIDKNLEKGIESGNEITLKVGSYYLVEHINMGAILQELGKLI